MEDGRDRFCPVFREYSVHYPLPVIFLDAPELQSPFCFLEAHRKKDPSNKKERKTIEDPQKAEKELFLSMSCEQRKVYARKLGPKVGYCETCHLDYDDVLKV